MTGRRYEATVIEADSEKELAEAEAVLVSEGGVITIEYRGPGVRAYRVQRPA